MKRMFILLLLIIQLNALSLPFGVKGGFNYTIPQTLQDSDYYYSDAGYDIGFFINIPIISNFYLNFDILYDSYNFKYHEVFSSANVGYINCKMLTTDILIMYNFLKKYFIGIGLFKGFGLKYSESIDLTERERTDFNSYGLLAGFSYQYNQNIIFDLRYLYNKSKLIDYLEETKKEPCGSEWNEDIACHMNKFHHIQFLIGYKF